MGGGGGHMAIARRLPMSLAPPLSTADGLPAMAQLDGWSRPASGASSAFSGWGEGGASAVGESAGGRSGVSIAPSRALGPSAHHESEWVHEFVRREERVLEAQKLREKAACDPMWRAARTRTVARRLPDLDTRVR